MYARLQDLHHESLYPALRRWLAGSRMGLLKVMLGTGLPGAFAVVTLDPDQWPVALGMLTLGGLGGWGILEHRLERKYNSVAQLLTGVVGALVLAAALAATFVALTIFMGPAPHF